MTRLDEQLLVNDNFVAKQAALERSVTQAPPQVDLSYDTHGEFSSVSAMIDETSSATVGVAHDVDGRLEGGGRGR
jgi:hypothetical protein